MCLIVDANAAHRIFADPPGEEAVPIWSWLERDGVIVYGGKLAAELERLGSVRRALAALVRAGRAYLENPAEVNAVEIRLIEEGVLKSDDPHVVALARVSGSRVLFTGDGALMQDFTDPAILQPRGRVYQRAEHQRLLRHRPGCRGRRRG